MSPKAALISGLAAVVVTVGGVPVAAAPAPAAGPPRTERISVTANGTQGDGLSHAPSLSADGRVAAFASQATNFAPDSVKYRPQVFWKDLRTGALTRVTARDVGAPADAWTDDPALSADGRHLAFASVSHTDDGRPGPPGEVADVYVRDLRTGRTVKANVGLDDGYGIVSRSPSLSADGRFVAFMADDTPWYPLGVLGEVRIYVRDLVKGVTQRVSAPPADWARAAASPKISADGRFVAYGLYVSKVSGPPVQDVYVTDRKTGRTQQVDVPYDGAGPSDRMSTLTGIGPDGRHVLFQTRSDKITPGDTNRGDNVFVRDLRHATTWRLDATEPGGSTSAGTFSADGRHLVFQDGTGISVRNLETGRTRRVLAPGTGRHGRPAPDAHARRIAFSSWATDLVPGDTNDTEDVFLLCR
ncbi:TolB family protein [Streptomyces sp. NRRL F-5755]|uniref:TolB family protein n=1 Tax=Streptomyces sp. NRRL F-5755 TaxID=1519475 RepID=UPI0006B024CE|nr:PD40 domain-containing protein [Streptomyces sp. NRRL F-5755]